VFCRKINLFVFSISFTTLYALTYPSTGSVATLSLSVYLLILFFSYCPVAMLCLILCGLIFCAEHVSGLRSVSTTGPQVDCRFANKHHLLPYEGLLICRLSLWINWIFRVTVKELCISIWRSSESCLRSTVHSQSRGRAFDVSQTHGPQLEMYRLPLNIYELLWQKAHFFVVIWLAMV